MKKDGSKSNNLFLHSRKYKIILWGIVICAASFILISLFGYIAAKKYDSFLPLSDNENFKSYSSYKNKIVLSNSWYILEVDEFGIIAVKTIKGEVIISGLTYYSEYEEKKVDWGLENVKVRLSNDSTISIQGNGNLATTVNISLIIHRKKAKIDFDIRTHYNLNTMVLREALVAKFEVPLSEVYCKNRKIDIAHFDAEYWLQQQGVRFGSGSRSSLIYHTPRVSSLQLNTKENLLFVNLEYFKDHPDIQIPFQKEGGGKWLDVSAAKYKTGDERNNYFSIYFGSIPKVIPRLMLVPHGYLAGYIFTEHADDGNIRTNRAAYFGDENITLLKNAVKGFAGHKIPVTKSVFYADSTKNPTITSIHDDINFPQFLGFLDQLYATGLYDFCLHTPESYTTNRKELTEAIKFMKNRFDSRTWIDHGFFGGNLNRECFVCDGLNPNSEFYAADLWTKYKTRYFWSTATELNHQTYVSPKEEIKKLRFISASAELWRRYLYQKEYKKATFFAAIAELFKGYSPKFEMNSLQPFKGNSYPTPLYWQNHTKTNYFYSWVTDFVYSGVPAKKPKDQISNELKQLDLLVANWGVYINHGYYVRNGKQDNELIECNGKIVINPVFDKILEYIAGLRDKTDLYTTTIRDLLDYWILLENISFEYMPDESIYVYNNNDQSVKGLSLVLNSNTILLDGKVPSSKKVKGETIICFDLPSKGHVIIQVKS